MNQDSERKDLTIEDISSKSFLDLTTKEIERLAQLGVEDAIKKTWAKGLPIIVSIDGRVCKRYGDGKIEWLE